MDAVTAIISSCRDDQHVPQSAFLDRLVEQWLRLRRLGQLAAADIDDVGAMLDGQDDRARQVEFAAIVQLTCGAA